jgi:hypothetical protein
MYSKGSGGSGSCSVSPASAFFTVTGSTISQGSPVSFFRTIIPKDNSAV